MGGTWALMKGFIFEHISGGGMISEPLPDELAAQGLAMLTCVAEDFVRMGIDVTITLDPRLSIAVEGVQRQVAGGATTLEDLVMQCADEADVTMIIAPEFNRLPQRWHQVISPVASNLLNGSLESLAVCSDKLALGELWQKAGVPTPPIERLTDATEWKEPVVIKPSDGAGCDRTCLCSSQLSFSRLTRSKDHLIQRYVNGIHASVLCIVNDDNSIQPLRAGRQIIDFAIEGEPRVMTYLGGEAPLPEGLEKRAIKLAVDAIKPVEGLRGFVGVDMVLGEGGQPDYAIEINPRVTMSYVGLRQLCEMNIAECLFDPTAGSKLAWRNASVRFDAAGTVMRSRG